MSLKKVFFVMTFIALIMLGATLEAYDVTYRAYLSNSQWVSWVNDGQTCGTVGSRYYFKAVEIALNPAIAPATVEYRVCMSSGGWQPWVAAGQTSGILTGSSYVNAIEIRLVNAPATAIVKYRVCDSRYGWLPWMTNGRTAGTPGSSRKIQAIEIYYYAAPICSTPPYAPAFWNDKSIVQNNNNCYNYSNNTRTDTFAQPGRASGNMYTSIDCYEVSDGAITDGLEPTTATAPVPAGKTKIALVIWPDSDYHWYRQDSDGLWSHKPGSTKATNLDNSSQLITNPELADRGPYTIFCGYFLTCSDVNQGQGNANIR